MKCVINKNIFFLNYSRKHKTVRDSAVKFNGRSILIKVFKGVGIALRTEGDSITIVLSLNKNKQKYFRKNNF